MPNIESERKYQKDHISKIQDRYLSTNTLKKVNIDDGYRYKVEILEKLLKGIKGLILDLGANTCGESEYLVNKGFNLVAGDINWLALSLSLKRTERFGYKGPKYLVFDAHSIPFSEGIFDCVITSEVLHHFKNLDIVLSELNRIVKDGGKLIALEPYAFNPYRKLSELPHYLFTGSIERSFSKKGLHKILLNNNFFPQKIKMVVLPPSSWKLQYMSKINAFKKKLYYSVASLFPNLFGLILIEALKCSNSSGRK